MQTLSKLPIVSRQGGDMRRTAKWWLAGVAGLLLAGAAAAQARGTGSGRSSVTQPATKGAGPAAERASMRPLPPSFDPRPGYMGGMGAAQERGGPLGPRADLAPPLEAARARQGEALRSWSSNDVRAARVQQAPDLNWVVEAAPGQGQEPQRKQLQRELGRSKR
ncbi:MAG TPA: hypothetical protein VF341_05305 [Anaeromyxobacteraceae bacterium]